MDHQQRHLRRREYLTKVLLTVLFLGIFAAFIFWVTGRAPGLSEYQLSVLDLVLLTFATFRLGRMIAYDLVMEPLRSPFARTVPDGSGAGDTVEPRGRGIRRSLGELISCQGAGDTVEPRGRGIRRSLGELISCPICVGTWVAAFLVYALYAFPGPARVFITIFAVIGAAELVNSLIELFCWSGQLARAVSGKTYSWHSPPPSEQENVQLAGSGAAVSEQQNGTIKVPEKQVGD